MNGETDSAVMSSTSDRLVVVHMHDGNVISGILQLHEDTEGGIPPHLPPVFHIQQEIGGLSSTLRVADSKAVFFVRTHRGDPAYEEMKFSFGEAASGLWIQIQLQDGEVLEGYVPNSIHWLVGPGLWLWPTDRLSNNTLIYVPKTSALELHVLGLTPFSRS